MILETISTLCLILGIFFSLTGAIGLFKFPDFFTRVHAASVTDTLAAILIILGLILRTEFDLVAAKLLLILVFLLPALLHPMLWPNRRVMVACWP